VRLFGAVLVFFGIGLIWGNAVYSGIASVLAGLLVFGSTFLKD
jgi:hypothetical protein